MKTMQRRSFVLRSMAVLSAGPGFSSGGCSDPESAEDAASDAVGGSTTGCCDDGTSPKTDSADPASSTTHGSTIADPTTTGTTSQETTTAEASSGGTSTGADAATGQMVCEPSPSDIEGPLYRPNNPVGGDLDVHGDSGGLYCSADASWTPDVLRSPTQWSRFGTRLQ